MRYEILFLGLIFLIGYSANAQHPSIIQSEFIFFEAPFKQCHASTIVSTPEGLVAAWFGGTREKNKDVEIWTSHKRGDSDWTEPVSVANGVQHKDKRYPTWNPVLFQVPEGPLMLFYKVGPNPSEWWGELKISDDHGKTWSKSRRLPEDIVGPIKNKPILTNDNRLISPSSTEHNGWQVHFEISDDLGNTWKKVGPINDTSDYNIIQPSILVHRNDTLQILARSMEDKVVSSWSYDGGNTWDNINPINLPNPNSGTDAVTLKKDLHLLVYNHSKTREGEWGGPRTPLNVAISKDGNNWENVITLEDEPGEYSYPAVIQDDDGLVHITYTWNRERIKHVVLDPEKLNI